MEILGFRDGFRGLVEDRRLKLDKAALAGILTVGGTILGTSRDKPHRMLIDGRTRDMTDVIVKNYHKYELECLVCLGGGGTEKARCVCTRPDSISSRCPRQLTTTLP